MAARRLLGDELKALRERADLKREQVAQRLDCHPTKIAHIENGRFAVKLTDLEALLRLYRAEHRTEELDAIRRAGSQTGWWAREDLPTWLRDLIGFENGALRERVVELELLPALLQTEEYARAVQRLSTVTLPSAEIDRIVAVRLQRQKRLTAPDPLELSAVISEGALLRVAADSSVGPGQLRKLMTDLTRPNVSLRVLPHHAGLHPASGAFTLLDFASNVPLKVAYEESALSGRVVEDKDVVRALSDLHERLRSQALDDETSLTLVTQLLTQRN